MTETVHEDQSHPQELQDAAAVVNMINGSFPNGNTIGEVYSDNGDPFAAINVDSRPQQDMHVADAKIDLPQGRYESTLLGRHTEASYASVSRPGYGEHTFSDKNAHRAAQIITGKAVDIIAPTAVAEAKKKVDTLNEQIERLS